jgi:hypothetical protein
VSVRVLRETVLLSRPADLSQCYPFVAPFTKDTPKNQGDFLVGFAVLQKQINGSFLAILADCGLIFLPKSLDGMVARSPQQHNRGEDICPSSMPLTACRLYSFLLPCSP